MCLYSAPSQKQIKAEAVKTHKQLLFLHSLHIHALCVLLLVIATQCVNTILSDSQSQLEFLLGKEGQEFLLKSHVLSY